MKPTEELLLEAIAASQDGLTLREIAERLRISQSYARMIVMRMRDEGRVEEAGFVALPHRGRPPKRWRLA